MAVAPLAGRNEANLRMERRLSSIGHANDTIFVVPDGDGAVEIGGHQVMTFERALRQAQPGMSVVLANGTYTPASPIVISKSQSGTLDAPIRISAENPRKCRIDGSQLPEGQSLFVLDADFWRLEGLVFEKSPLSGLTICGSYNRISNCEASGNGDTGILVISRPGADRDDWPQRNIVETCDSHDNCDPFGSNADGFGAKTRVGQDNVFSRCIAHHNADDGFDLNAEGPFGPSGAVELDRCVAYANGCAAGGKIKSRGTGCGFNMNGGSRPVPHEAWNCVAVGNGRYGFSSSSNPSCSFHFCTAGANGVSPDDGFNLASTHETAQVQESCLDIRATSGSEVPAHRMADGRIVLARQFRPRRKAGERLGASIDESLRILILVASLSGGGGERIACRLASLLSERHDVRLMYFYHKDEEPYPISPKVKVLDASFKTASPALTFFDKVRWALWGKKRMSCLTVINRITHRPDVTISLLETPNRINARYGGKRKVMSERNDPREKPGDYYAAAVSNYEAADYVVFQSRKVQSEFSKAVQRKSCVIPNPVTVSCLALPTSSHKIVTAGRLHPQKNQALLIRAFAAFHETHPVHTLHLYGEGPQFEELEGLVASLGVDSFVQFEGFCDEIHEAIGDAEMFVLSSDYEGMSNSLIEAMMMGLPCISTACTGSDELITDGEDGLLVPVGSEGDLCAAMERLADDAGLRAKISLNARLRALDFSANDVIGKWERIL